MALYHEATIRTAQVIIRRRKNRKEAREAEQFLLELDESKLLTLAMLADAQDEAGHAKFVALAINPETRVPQEVQQMLDLFQLKV